MTPLKERETWYPAGKVERRANRRYTTFDWTQVYSLASDGSIQPWQTRKEAQALSKAANRIAVFKEP